MTTPSQLVALAERKTGFKIKRKTVTLESNQPYDEQVPFALFTNVANHPEKVKNNITLITNLLVLYQKSNQRETKVEADLYSFLGNLYYTLEEFKNSRACFSHALSLERENITNWVEFMFSLRVLGLFEEFETIMFNFEKVYELWKKSAKKEMDSHTLKELLKKIENEQKV